MLALATTCLDASAAQPGKNQLTMSLQGPEVRATVTPPASEFSFADDDGDGLISLPELRAHRAELEDRFARAFQTASGTGAVPESTYLGVHVPQDAGANGADYLRFIVRRMFERPPERLEISYRLFENSSAAVNAWIIGSAGKVEAVLGPSENSFSYQTAPVAKRPAPEPEPGPAQGVASTPPPPQASSSSWTTLHTGLLVAVLVLLFGLVFLAYDARVWPFSLLDEAD